MKKLSKKAKLTIGWTILMTVIGTAILHQLAFFLLGLVSIALLLIANQMGKLD
jgi:hypothetical protein